MPDQAGHDEEGYRSPAAPGGEGGGGRTLGASKSIS